MYLLITQREREREKLNVKYLYILSTDSKVELLHTLYSDKRNQNGLAVIWYVNNSGWEWKGDRQKADQSEIQSIPILYTYPENKNTHTHTTPE